MATFTEIEGRYRALRAQLEHGELSQSQFLEGAAELMCQDEIGRWWTIHPESDIWHYRWRETWRPGVPPGQTSGVVLHDTYARRLPPEPAARPRPGTLTADSSRWLVAGFVGLSALALVLISVGLLYVLVIRPAVRPDQVQTRTLDTDTPPRKATVTPPSSPVASASPSPAPTASGTRVSPTEAGAPETLDTLRYMPDWPPALVDDFHQSGTGWWTVADEDALIDYRGGQLLMEFQGRTALWSTHELKSFGDGWAEVTVAEIGSAAGIAVHVTEDHYGYVFRIDSAGRYAIGRTLVDAEPPLVDWTPSRHLRAVGEPNRLAVMAEGDLYRFFINGRLQAVVLDEQYPAGRLALWGGTSDGSKARIAFDDARLLLPPHTTPADATPTKRPTQAPSGTLTPTPRPTGIPGPAIPAPTLSLPTATPVRTESLTPLAALMFDVHYQASYPGSGDDWIIRFTIHAHGGDGQYVYWVADRRFNAHQFDFEYGCGTDLVAEIAVESGDGQRATKTLYVEQVPCVTPP